MIFTSPLREYQVDPSLFEERQEHGRVVRIGVPMLHLWVLAEDEHDDEQVLRAALASALDDLFALVCAAGCASVKDHTGVGLGLTDYEFELAQRFCEIVTVREQADQPFTRRHLHTWARRSGIFGRS